MLGRQGCRNRLGAILSVELLILLPIVLILIGAVVEFGMLMSARTRVLNAAREAARIASLGGDHAEIASAVQLVLGEQLGKRARVFIDSALLDGTVERGDPVSVKVSVPSELAAPNLLRWIGIDRRGQMLESTAAMRRE